MLLCGLRLNSAGITLMHCMRWDAERTEGLLVRLDMH